MKRACLELGQSHISVTMLETPILSYHELLLQYINQRLLFGSVIFSRETCLREMRAITGADVQ